MAKSRVLHRLKERFGELIQEARLLSALVPLWCDTPRIPSSGPGLSLVARLGLTHVQTLSSTDEQLESCGPASRLSFLLRASVRRHRRAPGAQPNGVRGIDRLRDWVALLALGCRHSNPRFLYSWLCHRWRIDFLACFGGHQSNGRYVYHAASFATSSQKKSCDGFLYSSS